MSEGETQRSIPLGLLISGTGYSFSDEDLLDIAVTIDFDKAYAIMSVQGWEDVVLQI
mgnify:CR=1 FL=1